MPAGADTDIPSIQLTREEAGSKNRLKRDVRAEYASTPPTPAFLRSQSVKPVPLGTRGLPATIGETNLFRVLLHHPPLAKALAGLVSQLIGEPTLDPRLRELAVMRVAWRSGSVSQWSNHWHVGMRVGLAEDDIAAVRDWHQSDRFGGDERAVLAATDETIDVGRVGDETSACAAVLSDAALGDLVVAIGHAQLYAGVLRTFDVPLDARRDPWPPDGRAPKQEQLRD